MTSHNADTKLSARGKFFSVESETSLYNKMNIIIEPVWLSVRHLAACKNITALLRDADAALP